MKSDLNFYKKISKNSLPLTDLLKDESLFSSVPKNWSIVVTDIENSTAAVANGFHNDVNLCATGSIITVLNTIKTVNKKIEIPYFFGGDGSTFIIPNTILTPVLEALNNYSQHIKNTLNLNLRVGHLELEKVYNNNVTLRITKLRHNKYLTTPVVLGNGIKYAENVIKDNFKASHVDTSVLALNLEGMECRWDEIYPSQTDKKVICLLVNCNDEKKQAEIYETIMNEINYVFGDLNNRNPITALKLRLNTSIEKIKKEMHVKLGKNKTSYLLNNWLITIFGKYYFKLFKAGKRYVYKVSQLSDTIMLDGSINTVISGTNKQVSRLQILLDDLESNNKIIYGLHTTHASIMSCYIQDRKEKHIHFVDGTEGGYTSAAIMFKEKLKNRNFN
ncbi:DUF3095 domain-containing protein [Olleya sp. 1-3]|uniref:DUF3095 domain-containing protein n=1 Tax=Olleya sp. 1-3 TaxID=2058323 RepID=UPI000C339C97|nr:DUF3095 domain-containing protein [Olleya sp. 1-3]PKG50750.1 hypothetical protein CXF54_11375 [Olleya sp. 1-3]